MGCAIQLQVLVPFLEHVPKQYDSKPEAEEDVKMM